MVHHVFSRCRLEHRSEEVDKSLTGSHRSTETPPLLTTSEALKSYSIDEETADALPLSMCHSVNEKSEKVLLTPEPQSSEVDMPGEQRAMIEEDYKLQKENDKKKSRLEQASGVGKPGQVSATQSGQAIWNYGVETLDPVVSHTLVAEDNHYYLLCLLGACTRRPIHIDRTNNLQANTLKGVILLT